MGRHRPEEPQFEPEMLTSAELGARMEEQEDEWLVTWMFVKDQPGLIGGPSKTLKTWLAIDMAISLGSQTPFLGYFDVPKRVRTWFLSGESGQRTIYRNA